MVGITLGGINTAIATSVATAETEAKTQMASGDQSTSGILKLQFKMQDMALKTNLQSTLMKTVYDLTKSMISKFP